MIARQRRRGYRRDNAKGEVTPVGEVLGWIGLVLIISACGAGGVIYVNRLLRPREPLALRSGDDATRAAYKVARRSVRVLERLVQQDNLVPFLSAQDREEIDQIVRDFDDF